MLHLYNQLSFTCSEGHIQFNVPWKIFKKSLGTFRCVATKMNQQLSRRLNKWENWPVAATGQLLARDGYRPPSSLWLLHATFWPSTTSCHLLAFDHYRPPFDIWKLLQVIYLLTCCDSYRPPPGLWQLQATFWPLTATVHLLAFDSYRPPSGLCQLQATFRPVTA